MADKWLYHANGQPAYFQQDKHLYDEKTSQCSYWVQDGWIYEVGTGKATFFIQDKWVYTPNGTATFYFGD